IAGRSIVHRGESASVLATDATDAGAAVLGTAPNAAGAACAEAVDAGTAEAVDAGTAAAGDAGAAAAGAAATLSGNGATLAGSGSAYRSYSAVSRFPGRPSLPNQVR